MHAPLGAEFDAAEALAIAAEVDEGRTLLVGHEPGPVEQVVHDLTGASVELKKGGVAGSAYGTRHRGELIALLRPRELRVLG